MKRTFQLGDRHLWSIERNSKSVTVRWGLVGGKEQSRAHKHRHEGSAKEDVLSRIRDKLQAKYREITQCPQWPTLDRTGQLLEAALMQDPDDLAGHMAYADWLSEQDNPLLQARSEFIRVQLQLEGPVSGAKKRTLTRREVALRDEYEPVWLGAELARRLQEDLEYHPLNPESDFSSKDWSYRRGWLEELRIEGLTEAFARVLGEALATRLLRLLTIEGLADGSDPLSLLARAKHLGNVRHFRLHAFAPNFDLTPLVAALPRLEGLFLVCLDMPLGRTLALPSLANLRTLSLGGAVHFPFADLAANESLRQLQDIILIPGASHALQMEDLRRLTRAENLPALVGLTIHCSALGDELIGEVIESGILRRLKKLDLTRGAITDAGAQRLAACPDLGHLEELNLTYNRLTQAGRAALQKKGPQVLANYQETPNASGHYVPVHSYWNR